MNPPKEKLPKLVKKPAKKAISLRLPASQVAHLSEFKNTHNWSLNETIAHAVSLLVAIHGMDSEDEAAVKRSNKTPKRPTGRLHYVCRNGEEREFGTHILSHLRIKDFKPHPAPETVADKLS
jgi:hypothetical protein